jgi:hypothetical protein
MQVKLLSLTLGSLAVSRSSFRELHAALGHGFNPLNLLWMPENGKPEQPCVPGMLGDVWKL